DVHGRATRGFADRTVAIDEHQSAHISKIAQVEEIETTERRPVVGGRCAVTIRLEVAERADERRDPFEIVAEVDGTAVLNLFRTDRHCWTGQVEFGSWYARAGNDDRFGRLVGDGAKRCRHEERGA